MIKALRAGGIALVMACTATSTLADAPSIHLSGFGTLGMVAVNQSDIRFIRVGLDHPGAESPDFGPDTVLGIQGNVVFTPRTSMVVQLLSRESPQGDYTPRASLAFVSHSLAPELTVRAGRLRIPFFMLSDSLDINYANPWIRPPVEVYGLNPFSDLDGIDLLFRTRIANADLEIHPYLGRSYIPIHRDGKARLDRLMGVNLTLTTERFTLFVGHGESDLTLKWSDANFSLLTAIVPTEVNRELSGNDGYATFSSAGFQWDDGRWLLVGEYARRVNRRYANSAHGWHFTVGHRFENVMPYVTLARQTEDRPITTASVPAPLEPYLNGFLASRNMAQHSITLGARWDVRRDAALKVELSHTQTRNDSWGSYFPRGNPAITDPRDRAINMLGVALDVTF
ncbi:MAG: hypothetical protein Q7J47_13545 [Azoarcus sp.]|nr:hypothetical protein [Azoarcus sp.]